MCGIAGFWEIGGTGREAGEVLRRMTDPLRHRGPDDEGQWIDAASGVALGHRRLSVLDLSPLGHQPMTSADGRFVIVLNGEIYNFQDLRRELGSMGSRFRGRSDTEVALAAFQRWSVLDAVRRFVGMFALALYDRRDRALHLVRDRLGEKPLYYGWMGGTLLFGSELKALRAHPAFRGEVDRSALSLFVRYGYVPAPYCMYDGISKVNPGTLLSFVAPSRGAAPTESVYWSARDVAEKGIASPLTGSDDEIADGLEREVRRTIRDEMVADVPLGAFLSGGIDSSLVVALMQSETDRPIRTFTMGFREPEFDEAVHARAVARHLGTEHTDLYVTPADALAVVPQLPSIYDEPFSDSSQIPTYLIAQLARQHVTVSLSGDGGDEVFGGYGHYARAELLSRCFRWLPPFARRPLATILGAVTAKRGGLLLRALARAAPSRIQSTLSVDRVVKLAEALRLDGPGGLYRSLVSHWPDPSSLVLGGREPATPFTEAHEEEGGLGGVPGMMYLDSVTYLPDDVLVKVDRATMAVALESRAPFLDHRVYEFAWRVPARLKWSNGLGKRVLRQVLQKYVPVSLVDRPKRGFAVPLGEWLRGPLRDWASAQLDRERLRRERFFEARAIHTKWREHLSGAYDWSHLLWEILMFQAWLEAR